MAGCTGHIDDFRPFGGAGQPGSTNESTPTDDGIAGCSACGGTGGKAEVSATTGGRQALDDDDDYVDDDDDYVDDDDDYVDDDDDDDYVDDDDDYDDDDDDNGAVGGMGGVPGFPLATGGYAATGGRPGTGGLDGTGGALAMGGNEATGGGDTRCESLAGLSETCLAQATYAAQAPVNILLVIDRSGSLRDNAQYGVPKWEALTEALSGTLRRADVYDNPNVSVGLMLYPGLDVVDTCSLDECCQLPPEGVNVDIGAASDTVESIVDALDDAEPSGLTPTGATLRQVYRYFTTGAGSTLEGQKYVLLVSDGGPNCNGALTCSDDECTLALDGLCDTGDCCADGSSLWCVDHEGVGDTTTDLANMGVSTVVVGLPGSEPYADWYAASAYAGQAPVAGVDNAGYWAVPASGGEEALAATFDSIFTSLTRSCRIQLAETPPSTSDWLVNVAFDCQVVPRGGALLFGTAGAAGTGPATRDREYWFVDDSTDPPTIEIDPVYCEMRQQNDPRVDIILGCPPIL